MKKLLWVFAIMLLFGGCASSVSAEEDVLEIRERFFVMQFMEIFTNPEEFLGRTIRYEGMFMTIAGFEPGENFYYVYRYMDGCCSDEEPIGLEIQLNGMEPLAEDAWVEVMGVLEIFEEDGRRFLLLDLESMIEKEERGAEFVTAQ